MPLAREDLFFVRTLYEVSQCSCWVVTTRLLPPACFHLLASTCLLPPACFHPPAATRLLPPACFHLLATTCLLPPACYHLLATTCLLPPACYHLLATTCLLPPACYHLLATTCLLPPACYHLLATTCLLPPACYHLLATTCLLPPACYHLLATTCLLPPGNSSYLPPPDTRSYKLSFPLPQDCGNPSTLLWQSLRRTHLLHPPAASTGAAFLPSASLLNVSSHPGSTSFPLPSFVQPMTQDCGNPSMLLWQSLRRTHLLHPRGLPLFRPDWSYQPPQPLSPQQAQALPPDWVVVLAKRLSKKRSISNFNEVQAVVERAFPKERIVLFTGSLTVLEGTIVSFVMILSLGNALFFKDVQVQRAFPKERIVLFTGSLTVLEAHNLFRRKRLFIAGHGAALTNLVFMLERASVLEIRPDN
ncbi:unnamed protein product [Closterium sp. Naga37s-1]|nr:unnamed protein product [Closterium sp. Naga37s-1]